MKPYYIEQICIKANKFTETCKIIVPKRKKTWQNKSFTWYIFFMKD